jgi:hypothetical protein
MRGIGEATVDGVVSGGRGGESCRSFLAKELPNGAPRCRPWTRVLYSRRSSSEFRRRFYRRAGVLVRFAPGVDAVTVFLTVARAHRVFKVD